MINVCHVIGERMQVTPMINVCHVIGERMQVTPMISVCQQQQRYHCSNVTIAANATTLVISPLVNDPVNDPCQTLTVTSPPPTSATIKLPFFEQLSSRKPATPESASGVDTAVSYKDSDSSRRNRNVYIALLTRWRHQNKAGHSPYSCPSTSKTNTSHRRWTGRPPR